MMRYKRNAPLRYNFGEPISAQFKIVKIDDREVDSQFGKAEVLNISIDGACLRTEFNIPDINQKEVSLYFKFNINDKELNYTGNIVWKKELGKNVQYGLRINMNEQEKQQLIDELKVYSKKGLKDYKNLA